MKSTDVNFLDKDKGMHSLEVLPRKEVYLLPHIPAKTSGCHLLSTSQYDLQVPR